jgi:hypothetical protein
LSDNLPLISLGASPLSLRVALCSANFLFSTLLEIKFGLSIKFLLGIVLLFIPLLSKGLLNCLLNLVLFFCITVEFLVCVFAISIFFLGLLVHPDTDKVSFFLFISFFII